MHLILLDLRTIIQMFAFFIWSLLQLLLNDNAFCNVAEMGKSDAPLTVHCSVHCRRVQHFRILLVWKQTK